MRRLAPMCLAIVLMACAKKENQPADTGMAATPAPEAALPPPAAAPISLKDIAGTYAVTGKNEAGDSTLVTYELNTTDTAGWTIKFPNRAKTEKVRIVSVSGDSIVTEAGPYPSAIRKGAMVTTYGVYRMQDGKLVGRTVAHYNTKGPDSVLVILSEGVRK